MRSKATWRARGEGLSCRRTSNLFLRHLNEVICLHFTKKQPIPLSVFK
jgi:hypothetical protein